MTDTDLAARTARPQQETEATRLEALLGTDTGSPWYRRPALWLIAVLAIALAGGGLWWRARAQAAAEPSYVAQPVTRGDLALTVAANGTLQPTRSVNIGSELSGTVTRVLVDVNDKVTKGQVLVELDTAKLRDQIGRARANVSSAEARVAQAVATVDEARSQLARFEEVARLSGGQVPSKSELDTARAALARALADEAAARAGVVDAKAALSTDATNLSKASIRSPIDGVVLSRSVDPGNAVAASLQAVTLFTIAEDLTQMKLQVNVDEADVGAVKAGQNASFTVSAYPNRRFPASIRRVSYGATTTDNVVTYVAELELDNKDLTLRPGMTATATIATAERKDVLLVPNAALRFTPVAPGDSSGAAESARKSGGGIVASLMPQRMFGRRGGGNRRGNADEVRNGNGSGEATPRQVWVLRDGQAVPLRVLAGLSDGRMTEIRSDDLKPGMQVIVDQRAQTS